jgi:hypothetical protein
MLAAHRWLLFVHQLPARPSNLRVRTWRRLRQLGALPIKQSVYVLPDSAIAREDFEWLKTEVKSAGGEASVFTADHVDAWSDDALVEEFRRSRRDAYLNLAKEVSMALQKAARGHKPGSPSAQTRRQLDTFRQRLSAIDVTDFFGSPGRDRVAIVLEEWQRRHLDATQPKTAASSKTATQGYRGRLWVTRPRPGVDRMSSAWLIRRFVDPEARFGFHADKDSIPDDAVPFDMFGVDLSHQGDGCTFETLCDVFGITEPAVKRIATIVHDLDLKDDRFGASEAPTIGSVIEGLQMANGDDAALLEQGMTLFESLYRAFERSSRPSRPERRRQQPKRRSGSGGRSR